MTPIGIMQGRLSPQRGARLQSFPWESWDAEFARARGCGLDGIEWIFEEPWEQNPMVSPEGRARIEALTRESGVHIPCVCGDYFMEHPLVRVDGAELRRRVEMLRRVVAECAALHIPILDIPFVDASAIHNEAEAAQVGAVVRDVADEAEQAGVRIGLETNLGPAAVDTLLNRIDHRDVGVTYDIGNSASLGFDPREELVAYATRVVNVHVKDRVRGAGTVALGQGAANLPLTLTGLRDSGYRGPLILQVARVGDELAHARANAELVRRLWEGAAVA